MIVLVVMTDGRRECLLQSMESLERLDGPISRRVIHDDSGDHDHHLWIMGQFPGWDYVFTGTRSGFDGAYRSVRDWLKANTTEPYVLSTEDDFVIQRPVELDPLLDVLDAHPYLAQLVAKRQAWNRHERAAGGIIEQDPSGYDDMMDRAGTRWVEHRRFWSTNTSLFRRALLDPEWPTGPESEGRFTHHLLQYGYDDIAGEDVRFGFIGGRFDPPLIEHIGHFRNGTGY